jgi:hypothetical protein
MKHTTNIYFLKKEASRGQYSSYKVIKWVTWNRIADEPKFHIKSNELLSNDVPGKTPTRAQEHYIVKGIFKWT